MESTPDTKQLPDYVDALVQSAAQISMIISQMEHYAKRSGAPRTRATVSILSELVEGILSDPELELDLSGLGRGTELLVTVTDAIGNNLFFVDPDGLDEAA
jgi:hypothetical protein